MLPLGRARDNLTYDHGVITLRYHGHTIMTQFRSAHNAVIVTAHSLNRAGLAQNLGRNELH